MSLNGEIHIFQQQSNRQMKHAEPYKSEEYSIKKEEDCTEQIYNIRKNEYYTFIKNSILRFKEICS